jgi:hypothetical protein
MEDDPLFKTKTGKDDIKRSPYINFNFFETKFI